MTMKATTLTLMRDRPFSRRHEAERVLDDIWRVVSSTAEQVDDVAPVAASLLQLPRSDLRYLSALHLVLSPEAEALMAAAPGLLRHLTTSTQSPLDDHPERIRGPVDWGATLPLSAATGRRYAYRTRPTERDYDTAENRVLLGSLRALVGATDELAWPPGDRGIGQVITSHKRTGQRLLAVPVARTISTSAALADVRRVERGRAARRFLPATAFMRLHERLLKHEDPLLLRSMVERALLLATSDGALVEVLTLFATLRGLERRGWSGKGLHLVHGHVQVRLKRGSDRVSVHYRGRPTSLPERYAEVLDAHGLPKRPLQPDVILAVTPLGQVTTLVMVEVKKRVSADQAVRAALLDSLAYRDNYGEVQQPMVFAGVAWGADLSPSATAPVRLCTIDRLEDLLVGLGL